MIVKRRTVVQMKALYKCFVHSFIHENQETGERGYKHAQKCSETHTRVNNNNANNE